MGSGGRPATANNRRRRIELVEVVTFRSRRKRDRESSESKSTTNGRAPVEVNRLVNCRRRRPVGWNERRKGFPFEDQDPPGPETGSPL